jgi:hypothetical protein
MACTENAMVPVSSAHDTVDADHRSVLHVPKLDGLVRVVSATIPFRWLTSVISERRGAVVDAFRYHQVCTKLR